MLLASLPVMANSFYFAWSGYGVSTRYNYNLGMCSGAYYYRGVAPGLGLGTLDFLQNFSTNYNAEAYNQQGTSMRTNVTYHFFSPMVVFQLSHTGQNQMYCTGGIGQLQNGSELTMTQWNRSDWQGPVYDTAIDLSKKLNKYVFRLGLGFAQFLPIKGNFHIYIAEDAGFLIKPVTDVSAGQYSMLKTNASWLFQPTYISIRVGIGLITHSRDKVHPWRLYPGEQDKEDFSR